MSTEFAYALPVDNNSYQRVNKSADNKIHFKCKPYLLKYGNCCEDGV